MARLGLAGTSVFHSSQPDEPDSCVTVYPEIGERVSMHGSVVVAAYQAIIRDAKGTAETVGEARAKALLDAVTGLHNRSIYYGAYLSAAMNNTSDPVTFAPDDNGGTPTTKAAIFAVNDYVMIDSEILKVTSVSSPNVVASRAQLGTTIASHLDNAAVHNIMQCPIPTLRCGSTFTDDRGVLPMGLDEKERREWAVNWFVRVKP
jgi:hypothetical protein